MIASAVTAVQAAGGGVKGLKRRRARAHVWLRSSIMAVILPSCPTWHSKNRVAKAAVTMPLSLDGTNTKANCAISSRQCRVKTAYARHDDAALR